MLLMLLLLLLLERQQYQCHTHSLRIMLHQLVTLSRVSSWWLTVAQHISSTGAPKLLGSETRAM